MASEELRNWKTGDGKPEAGNDGSRERTAGLAPGLRIGANIAQRLIRFAAMSLRVARALPKDPVVRHIAVQLTRSATSVGANYEEARAAESKADFIHKLGIATKELRETIYWLALIATSDLAGSLDGIRLEADELAAILGASIRTAKRGTG